MSEVDRHLTRAAQLNVEQAYALKDARDACLPGSAAQQIILEMIGELETFVKAQLRLLDRLQEITTSPHGEN